MAKVPLAQQMDAVDQAIRLCLDLPELTEKLAVVNRTLLWLEANVELIREMQAINQDEVVKAIKAEFPGSRITKVRHR